MNFQGTTHRANWLLLISCFFLTTSIHAQAPPHYQGLNYQAVARDASGDPLTNTTISLRCRILRDASPGFEDTHTITTNDQGLFTAVIGTGGPPVGIAIWSNFEDIDWSDNHTFNLEVYADFTGGTNYQLLGSEIIRTVPYAAHAAVADNATLSLFADSALNASEAGTLVDSAWVVIPDSQVVFSKSGYRVGIGVLSPTACFHVAEDAMINGIAIGRGGGNQLSNLALGSSALTSNQTGTRNHALGNRTLIANINGDFNTAVGNDALFLNTDGDHNVAVGHGALESNLTGSANTAVGTTCLVNNTSHSNTGVGMSAMSTNTTGNENTAVGARSMFWNTVGSSNTAIGAESLYNNQGGGGNCAFGRYALRDLLFGASNTGIGFHAGYDIQTGSLNVLVGNFSGTSTGVTNLERSIAIGEGARVSASNHARIGTNFTVSIGGYQAWTSLSDGRMKKNVVEDVSGLDLILKLRPVTCMSSKKVDQSGV